MAAGPHQRTLTAELRTWGADQVAALLVRRRDLAWPDPPADVVSLAQRAQSHPSVTTAIASASLAEHRLLQLLVCCPPAVTTDELARSLPPLTTLADIEPVLAGLEATALVWRHGARVHCSGTLRQCMPTTLGPPLVELLGGQTVDYLRRTIEVVRAEVSSVIAVASLPTAIVPGGRLARKAELIGELDALLSAPGVIEELLANGPDEARELAATLASGPPGVVVDHPLYRSNYSWYGDHPTYWLFERALLLPGPDQHVGWQPRCVGVALRDGVPVGDLALSRPDPVVATVDRSEADDHGAAVAQRSLDQLADVLEAWAAEPPKQLKTGGLGVSVLRPLSTRLDVDVTDAARIVELLWLAGLLEVHTVTRKEGRLHVTDSFVRPTGAAAAWLARSTSERWGQLATAWRRAERWPSAAGRPDPNGKAVPVLSPQPRGDAAALRAEVLAAVAALDDADGGPADRCAATSAAALAASVYWTCPEPWLHNPIGEHATMISWIYEEAELLGVIAEGRMSSFGRALLDGDAAAAGRLFDAARPTLATSFTVQADLTVVVVGAGAREVTTELRLLADVESTGAATTYRITETGIRRAIDAGRDAASILAFLRAHATRGLPTALEYLVGDVERRHGHLRVASATTVITADDPAVLADACAHRLSRKLGLRLLAPTVATSALPIDKVVGGLRAAGFFPASDDGGAAPQEGAIGLSPAVERSAGDDAELPERFAHRAARTTSPPALDAASAAALAAAIISAAPEGDGRPQRARGATADVLPFDDQREGLHALLSAAAHAGHVVAVARGGGRADDKPILLTNVDWDGGMLRGTSLLDGLSVELHPDEIETALDAGPFDGMFNDQPRRPARSKQRRRR